MCTVTYFPKGKDHFILTSNRDEAPDRASSAPDINLTNSRSILFPRDPRSGGTWIAAAKNHRIGCVLNGAYYPHTPTPPYTRSRGLVILDFFKYPNIDAFVAESQLSGIEPFTLVLYEPYQLTEFRWDGTQKHRSDLDSSVPHLWGSITLYDDHIISKRRQWYQEWLNEHANAKVNDLLQFHQFGGEPDDINGLVINREDVVRTLSITSVEKNPKQVTMYHRDLLHDELTIKNIRLSHAMVESN